MHRSRKPTLTTIAILVLASCLGGCGSSGVSSEERVERCIKDQQEIRDSSSEGVRRSIDGFTGTPKQWCELNEREGSLNDDGSIDR